MRDTILYSLLFEWIFILLFSFRFWRILSKCIQTHTHSQSRFMICIFLFRFLFILFSTIKEEKKSFSFCFVSNVWNKKILLFFKEFIQQKKRNKCANYINEMCMCFSLHHCYVIGKKPTRKNKKNILWLVKSNEWKNYLERKKTIKSRIWKAKRYIFLKINQVNWWTKYNGINWWWLDYLEYENTHQTHSTSSYYVLNTNYFFVCLERISPISQCFINKPECNVQNSREKK